MSFGLCENDKFVKYYAIRELMDDWLARIRERRSALFTCVRPQFPLYRAQHEPSVLTAKMLREREGFSTITSGWRRQTIVEHLEGAI